MTFKTLIATAAIALAFAPSASAAAMVDSPAAAPASAQQAKWRAYDAGARKAYAPAAKAAERPTLPVAEARDISTGTRVVLGFIVFCAAAMIVAVRKRDSMFRPASGGWDI